MTQKAIIVNHPVVVNQMLQEQLVYGDPDFPVARFLDKFNYFANSGYLCHWHSEFELVLVLQGEIEFQIDQDQYVLSEGQGVFINSKALHSAHQLERDSVAFNIVFHPALFHSVGSPSSYQKYFSSICSLLKGACLITDDSEEGAEILERLRLIQGYGSSEYAYELLFMEELLCIWRHLLKLMDRLDYVSAPFTSHREDRMREMLDYIHSKFSGSISVQDLAEAANVSRSECYRCFETICHMPPIEYLKRYRLQHASQLIISSDESISNICYASGFSSLSYFGKVFKTAYGCSPSDYRKKAKANLNLPQHHEVLGR